MTPAARRDDGRPTGRPRDWTEFDRPYAPRRSVAGGVAVPRRWKPAGEEAVRLGEVVERRTTAGISSRGRTYGRAGQVVEVRIGPADAAGGSGRADAAIQGSDDVPYAVSLTRAADGDLEATCTCPYGCDAVEWCKHAAALAFVVGYLVDTDAGLAGAWTGSAARGPVQSPVAGPGAAGPGAAAAGGTDSSGTDSSGTDSSGTDSSGTGSSGTGSSGTGSRGTGSRGTGSASAGSASSGRGTVSGLSEPQRSVLVDRLRTQPQPVDAAAAWRAAVEVLPPP